MIPLTPREFEILKYVAGGNGNKAIANQLKISEQVIKNHISLIMYKLAANDRTHAVVLAIEAGLMKTTDAIMLGRRRRLMSRLPRAGETFY